MKILVVDDQPQVASTHARLFKSHGHEVCVAHDAKQAVWWIEGGFKPDLIVSDWNMPMMTGGDLCRLMRQVGYTGAFFIVSGELRTLEVERCGATDCYLKPLTRGDITSILARAQPS